MGPTELVCGAGPDEGSEDGHGHRADAGPGKQ